MQRIRRMGHGHRKVHVYRRSQRGQRLAGNRWLRIGVPTAVVLLLVVIGTTAIFGLPRLQSHAAATVNGDCSLIVPTNPLTAQGLSTPYQLVATNPANGPCNEANKAQAAFVQGAVIDPATGAISIYNPLVIDQGTQPAAQPVVPTLPQGGIVGLWFGSNGNNLTLQDTNGSLKAGNCVNGINNSVFGQFAYCNATTFFQAVNQAIQGGKLNPPPLGTAKDGATCPSVRDFSVVDMDQSDNVTTPYLVTANGQTAQSIAANMITLPNAQALTNASDNRLLSIALDGALGCTPWMAADLADPGKTVPALPLDEVQAAIQQAKPVALIPNFDPMVVVNKQRNLNKLNAYRVGVDQPTVQNANMSSTLTYCTSLRMIGPTRMLTDAPFTLGQASPDPAAANSLLTFLEQRFVATYGANGLNCQGLLKMPDPITVQTDANGVAINGTINGVANGTQNPPGAAQLDCAVNGTVVKGCTGTTTINGQACTFALDTNMHQVNITCPKAVGG
ncbi:MAG: hypothetical protein ABI396_05615 [Ktedonobacteraceae bacterium]